MGVVYHGSPYGGLKVIERKVSTHGRSCVYATDNEVVATLFLARGNGNLDVVIGVSNGKIYVVERRENVLFNLYNRSGYMYELDDKNFCHYDYLWGPEMISFEDEIVLSEKKVENILEKLCEFRDAGMLTIYFYPNRPSNIPLDNSDLIDKYISFEKNGIVRDTEELFQIYPEFREEVERRLSELEAKNVRK